jgi:hypothetical protein
MTIGPVVDTPVAPPEGVTLTNSVVTEAEGPVPSLPQAVATARDASKDPASIV